MFGEGVEAVQIGYNAKSRAVGLRPAAERPRHAQATPPAEGPVAAGRCPARLRPPRAGGRGARGLTVEEFGGGVVGVPAAGGGDGRSEGAQGGERDRSAEGGGRLTLAAHPGIDGAVLATGPPFLREQRFHGGTPSNRQGAGLEAEVQR